MLVSTAVTKNIAIRLLALDSDVQMRSGLSSDLIREYAESMSNGTKFPPIVVYTREGLGRYYVADGFHRVKAAMSIHLPNIFAEVRDGSKRDAILCAVGANANHGMRRTPADKRRSIIALLTDPEWCKWATAEIARRCNVSHALVEDVRRILDVHPKTRIYKRGTTTVHRTMTDRAEEHTTDPDTTLPTPAPKVKLCRTCGQPMPE